MFNSFSGIKEEKNNNIKGLLFIILFIILLLSKNIYLDLLTNNLLVSKLKKYHFFLKYLKLEGFKGYLKKIVNINEIIYLNNIRKEINFYKDMNYSSIQYKSFLKVINPKISIILTVFNQEKYLLRIYTCIINQSFKQIEIIIIDDNSSDNSFLIIKKMMEYDKRIIYIRNRVNKGQFYSRNRAALISKGKYIMIIDPDDFLLCDILSKSYKVAKKFNLDILQFYHIMGNYSENHLVIVNPDSRVKYHKEAKNIFFNYKTRYLWDKLIKKNIFIKSIFFMHQNYRKERILIHNDDIACFGLFKMADSYGQIEEVGYFYNTNISNSTTKKNFIPESINGRFHSMFTIMKYYYEQSEDNIFEKNNGGYTFFTFRIIRKYKDKIQYLTKGFNYINNVIDIYLNSPYFNYTEKMLLKEFKFKINNQKKNITKHNFFNKF